MPYFYRGKVTEWSNVETVLRGVGIQTRETNDEFRDFDDILDDVGQSWNSYSGVQQRAISQAISGTNHMNEFMVLMQNYSKAQEYAELATNSSGQSMEKYSAYTESLAGQLEGLKNSFQTFSNELIDSDILKTGMEIGSALLDGISQGIELAGVGGSNSLINLLAAGIGLKQGISGGGKVNDRAFKKSIAYATGEFSGNVCELCMIA